MFKVLLFLFITVPLLEIYLLLQVGGYIGAMNTIALILLTAIIGTAMLRQQGLATLARVRQTLDQGRLPAGELISGLLLLLAGALLLTPGFFTDAVGFICLIPVCREWFAEHILTWLLHHQQRARNADNPDIIEGEFWEENNRKDKDYLP